MLLKAFSVWRMTNTDLLAVRSKHVLVHWACEDPVLIPITVAYTPPKSNISPHKPANKNTLQCNVSWRLTQGKQPGALTCYTIAILVQNASSSTNYCESVWFQKTRDTHTQTHTHTERERERETHRKTHTKRACSAARAHCQCTKCQQRARRSNSWDRHAALHPTSIKRRIPDAVNHNPIDACCPVAGGLPRSKGLNTVNEGVWYASCCSHSLLQAHRSAGSRKLCTIHSYSCPATQL
jgi:hypothetical protein